MLKEVSETPKYQPQHFIHLDPRMVALYKNLDRIDSVVKLVKTLSPADFSSTEDEVWNHMGQVLGSAVGNLKRIAGQLETQMLIKVQHKV